MIANQGFANELCTASIFLQTKQYDGAIVCVVHISLFFTPDSRTEKKTDVFSVDNYDIITLLSNPWIVSEHMCDLFIKNLHNAL